MARYIVINSVRGVLTIVAVSFIVFFLARLTGDPLDVLAPVDMGREDEQALREQWGLDKPLPQQYFSFVGNALHGDFGPSFLYPTETAGSIIADRLPASIRLGLVATVLVVVIGVPLGILSAVNAAPWRTGLPKAWRCSVSRFPNSGWRSC